MYVALGGSACPTWTRQLDVDSPARRSRPARRRIRLARRIRTSCRIPLLPPSATVVGARAGVAQEHRYSHDRLFGRPDRAANGSALGPRRLPAHLAPPGPASLGLWRLAGADRNAGAAAREARRTDRLRRGSFEA